MDRWMPFAREMDMFHNELQRLFDEFFASPAERTKMAPATWIPTADLSETPEEFILRAELPGIKQEDVDITLTDDTVSIKGERKKEEEVKGENYIRLERSYGSFYRSFKLSTPVDADKVKASYKDGVLEVRLPKTEKVKPKKIKIE